VDPKREIYFFISQLLDYSTLKIVNSENNPEKWSEDDIRRVIQAGSSMHKSVHAASVPSIQTFEPWRSKALYKKLLTILIDERADAEMVDQLVKLRDRMDKFEEDSRAILLDRVVIHNDFNPRNIAIGNDGDPLIYDWELAVIDLPHRDVVEFLSFVLPEDVSKETLLGYLKFHHSIYSTESWEEWLTGYQHSLRIYIATRVSLYEVSGILIKYDFSRRILKTSLRMLMLIE
jgi:hydroxymethylglutaryl-CoA reductase (NADPH)